MYVFSCDDRVGYIRSNIIFGKNRNHEIVFIIIIISLLLLLCLQSACITLCLGIQPILLEYLGLKLISENIVYNFYNNKILFDF